MNEGATDLTGGPNGISDLDPISFLGCEFESLQSYFCLSLAVFALVFVALHFLTTRAPAARGARCARTRSRPSR